VEKRHTEKGVYVKISMTSKLKDVDRI